MQVAIHIRLYIFSTILSSDSEELCFFSGEISETCGEVCDFAVKGVDGVVMYAVGGMLVEG
jgi:hypothetical protein